MMKTRKSLSMMVGSVAFPITLCAIMESCTLLLRDFIFKAPLRSVTMMLEFTS